MNLDKLKKSIELYKSFINDNKVNERQFPYYQKLIDTKQNIIHLLETNALTPEIFEKFDSVDKWDISYVLEDVEWLCKKCKTKIPYNITERAYMGNICCEFCDNELTHRTVVGKATHSTTHTGII